ncbi:glycoside hydrolase family 47 protein [Pholiota molesta]|nr:glycoside hydrolase family 47 protein [Pholiota molesta]
MAAVLPVHRPPPAIEHLSKLSRSSYHPFSKFAVRWILLACVTLVSLYFALPVIGGIFWKPHDMRYPPPPPPPHMRPGPPPHSHERPIKAPPPPPTFAEQDIWNKRKIEVRETFQRAWSGYKARAFPDDELSSIQRMGVTVFDSLPTMWVMGLSKEFSDAVESVKDQHFLLAKSQNVPFFETVIRYLGGSLSAYALSGNEDMLKFAEKLGDALLPAFNTPSGLPSYAINVGTGEMSASGATLFAEAASCQLEYKYLAKLTGKKEYYQRVQAVMDLFYKENPEDGLYALTYDRADGTPASKFLTAGSMADSGYEYFLKQWIMTGDIQARNQYIKSANGIIKNLIHVTPNRGLMYAGDMENKVVSHRYQHLTCYLPGMLMLGVSVLDLTPEERELHQWAAEGLTYTCYISYRDQKTNLGPEIMSMVPAPGLSEPPPEKDRSKRDYSNSDAKYMLRPETVESIFYMWRFTGDVKWRQRGYEIHQAIMKHTRTEYGYASISDVDSGSHYMDEMQSFFLAETLKYLYLLFDDVNSFNLTAWVFNTEAHPLPLFSWTDAEKETFAIQS